MARRVRNKFAEACKHLFLWSVFACTFLPLYLAQRFGASPWAIGAVIAQYGSLEACFADGGRGRTDDRVRSGLAALRAALSSAMQAPAAATNPDSRAGLSAQHGHLLPNPAGSGCCKRWMLFLRWMVRPNDGVDLGLWSVLRPAELVIPLDRHISRLARSLALTERRSDSWATALEITAALREFDQDDPIRFDFALCHLGISGACRHHFDAAICPLCSLRGVCRAGSLPA